MLTIINIISAIPILLYPFILVAGVMSFDTPSSTKSLITWIIFIASLGYPVFIIILIMLSRRYDSVSLAFFGLIPLLFLFYSLFIYDGFVEKNNYNNLNKDFICDQNSFLSLYGKGDPIGGINLFEKKNFFTYKKESLARIYEDKWMVTRVNSEDVRERVEDLFTNCKNSNGQSPSQVFTPTTSEQVRTILKKT